VGEGEELPAGSVPMPRSLSASAIFANEALLALCTFQVEIIRDFLKSMGLHSGQVLTE
jgi:hypothetical protein